MLYRENGQFKTSYRADQQVFPILQDRVIMLALLVIAFTVVPLIASLLLGGLCATVVGVLFGVPSLRIKGLYLAVATLAAQFFLDWAFLRIPFFTNNSSSGSVSVASLSLFGISIESPASRYLFCLLI